MIFRAKLAVLWVGGISLAAVISAQAGEKIQFSRPSEAVQTAPEKDAPTKNSPGLFDNFKHGGADTFNITPSGPARSAPERPGREKKDWLLSTPEDSPTLEEVLKIKGFDGSKRHEAPDKFQNSLSRHMDATTSPDAKSAQPNLRDSQFESPFSDLSLSPPSQDWQRSTLNFSEGNRSFNEQFTGLPEYLKERTPERERFEQLNLARRNEFQQIFQNRTTLESTGTLNPLDATRQPANQPVSAPTDLFNRTTQSSFSDATRHGFEPLSATRSSALEDVNTRALGRTPSIPLNTVAEPLRLKQQPAVLPFPARPGSLNHRP